MSLPCLQRDTVMIVRLRYKLTLLQLCMLELTILAHLVYVQVSCVQCFVQVLHTLSSMTETLSRKHCPMTMR